MGGGGGGWDGGRELKGSSIGDAGREKEREFYRDCNLLSYQQMGPKYNKFNII